MKYGKSVTISDPFIGTALLGTGKRVLVDAMLEEIAVISAN